MININDRQNGFKHLIRVEDLTNGEVMNLIDLAKKYKLSKKVIKKYNNYFVSNLFFENSTRTHKSFEVAELRLGFNIVPFEISKSSVIKGEIFYDTVLTMSAIGMDILVIRHNIENYYDELLKSKSIKCSIINGGDGTGEHPSQCLLDIMTIYEEFGSFKNLNIAIIGDIYHSRVAKSNMKMLKRLGANLYFSGPKEWFSNEFEVYGSYDKIDKLVLDMDVIMLLRVQHERHNNKNIFSKEDYNKEYGLTVDRYKLMKSSSIIMHPAPINRDVEIDSEIVESEKSRIVQQMNNGVFMRMAILESIMEYRKGVKCEASN